MPEGERDRGWKPSGGAFAALIVAALALAGLTCWAFKINRPDHDLDGIARPQPGGNDDIGCYEAK